MTGSAGYRGLAATLCLATAVLLVALPAPAGSPPELYDLEGRRVDPLDAETPVTVFVFVRTDCPIANRYAPEVRALFEKYAPRGVAFWLVYLDRTQSAAEVRRHLEEFDYGELGVLRDPEHALVRRTGARVTPEVAVFVKGRGMLYRGRIDDRYVAFGKARREPTRRDLDEALLAALEGGSVVEPTTRAVGCFIADLADLE